MLIIVTTFTVALGKSILCMFKGAPKAVQFSFQKRKLAKVLACQNTPAKPTKHLQGNIRKILVRKIVMYNEKKPELKQLLKQRESFKLK